MNLGKGGMSGAGNMSVEHPVECLELMVREMVHLISSLDFFFLILSNGRRRYYPSRIPSRYFHVLNGVFQPSGAMLPFHQGLLILNPAWLKRASLMAA